MLRKTFSVLILIALLTSILTSTINIQPVEASGTIYIRGDGSVDPPTAPIQRVGDTTYIFTANISDAIVVERNSIVVDGAGYTLQGLWNGIGIDLSNRINVTVKNTKIKNFGTGILLSDSSGNTLSGDTITNNTEYGINLLDSSRNMLQRNNLIDNFLGINLDGSGFNTLSENTVTNNYRGICLSSSSGNTLSGNTVTDNQQNPILLSGSSNNKLSGNTVANNNYDGIWLWGSSGNRLSNNTVTINYGHGIVLQGSFRNRLHDNNIIDNHQYGIYLRGTIYFGSTDNTIFRNTVTNNGGGILIHDEHWLPPSSGNMIYHNNFIDNTVQVSVEYENSWDDGYPSGGNYWSDYIATANDTYSGPFQNETGSDGIGDTPYIINAKNQDRYPLMNPWTPPPTPDFSIEAFPASLTIQQGNSDTSVITITSINGFNQPVQLTVSGAPSGVTATLNPEQVTPPPDGSATSTLTVSVSATATPGSYTLTVTGSNGTLTHSTYVLLEITAPTLIPGKDVPTEAPDFFPSVLTKLDIPTTEFAVQALTIWTNYENTNAYWNPLATTWDMGEKSWDFNEAGVKNYIDKETGIQATANTLVLHYYEPIREMLAIQSFNEQQLKEAVATWSGLDPADPYVVNLVNEWRSIYPENQPPVAHAGLDQSVSSGDLVQFNGSESYDSDGTIISYRWNFGDESTAEGKVVNHRFRGAQNEPKTYTVTLTVEDDLGGTATDTVYVTVAPLEKTVEVSDPPILAKMTVTYNWIEKSNGEDVYIISKIHVEANGFVGVFVPTIWEWKGLLPSETFYELLFVTGGKAEKTYVYPFSTKPIIGKEPPLTTRTFYEGTFKGIQVKGTENLMSIHAQGFTLKLWPPWEIELDVELLEFAAEHFVPHAPPVEPGLLQQLLDKLLDLLADLHIVNLGSPGELRVYDSEGRVTGLVNGEIREEISNSVYFNNTVMILSSNSSYRYEVAGTEDGSYELLVASFVKVESYNFTATDILISTNAIHQYTIDWSVLSQGEEGVTVKVDSNDDGTFEKTFTSDSELTRDEFMLQVQHAEAFPLWILGVAVAAAAGTTVAIAVFWRRRKQPPIKEQA